MADNIELKTQEPHISQYAPGRKLLMATSILLLIHGLLVLVYILPVSVLLAFIVSSYYVPAVLPVPAEILLILLMFFLFVLLPVLQVYIGIIGTRNYDNVEKARKLRVAGVISLVIAPPYIAFIILAIGGILLPSTFVASLVSQILYLYGAHKNLGAWKENPSNTGRCDS